MADDDFDPADWLSSQFGQDEPEKAPRRRGVPAGQEPTAPQQPTTPLVPQEPAAPPPPVQQPTTPYIPAQPYVPPVQQGPPPAAPGGGFSWGLTPGGATPEPVAPVPPVAAPQPAVPEQPAVPAAPADPLAGLFGAPALPEPPAPEPAAPAPPAWDVPTQATPVQPAADPAPTVAFGGADLVRQEFPAFGVPPVDTSLGGVTEVLGAQPVGLDSPVDEGIESSAIDSLFGDSAFVEYEDAGLIPSLPPRASSAAGGELVVVDRPKAPTAPGQIPRVQKILMGVAGGLIAVLLLIVLFVAGQRIGASSPAPAAEPAPSASALPTTGPLPPGEYYWQQLRGGECLAPFTTPWADTFTVVPCTQPHPAQLAYLGTFAQPAADLDYPGGEELQKLAATQCAVPSIIDYAAVGTATDVQIVASFAPDEQSWLDGDRSLSCFVTRTGGAEFTTSVAVPQVAATPTPGATPTP